MPVHIIRRGAILLFSPPFADNSTSRAERAIIEFAEEGNLVADFFRLSFN